MNNVPVKVLLKLFSSLVSPILLYCSEVWRVHLLGRLTNIEIFKKKLFNIISNVEKLHIKFCKRVLGVHSKSTNLAVIAELGRYPMIIQISTLVIKYWLRINSRIYEDQFVGKAARLCTQSSLPIAKFNAFLLKLCNFSHLENNTLWKENDINNVAKAIKKELRKQLKIIWNCNLVPRVFLTERPWYQLVT